MTCDIELRPRAIKDLARLSPSVARRISGKIEEMRGDLAGDVKRLTDHTPEYRVGDWRALFEIGGARIVIYGVLHRSKAHD